LKFDVAVANKRVLADQGKSSDSLKTVLGLKHIFESKRVHLLGYLDKAADQSRDPHPYHRPPSHPCRRLQLCPVGRASDQHRCAIERRFSLRLGCADESADF